MHHLDDAHGTGEVGYWMAPTAERGHRRAAVDAATPLRVRGARPRPGRGCSTPSRTRRRRGSALRCGYLLEGTARESFVYGDGLRHDEHLHARLAKDPHGRRAPR